MANMLDEAFETRSKTQAQSSKGEGEKEEEITFPPKGFNVKPLEETPKYQAHFARRTVCKTHYIDYKILQEVLKFDLSPYLDPYMPWLSIKLPFCTKIVRHFYCNLEPVDESLTNSLEEMFVSKVRGQEIFISPSKINTWLGIENPPDDIYSNLDPNQLFSVLRPGEPVGPLNFKPSDMSDFHRVLWYIYSRSLVNKANNYTHFIERDFRKFASLLLKEEKDLGEYIFAEIKRYRLEGKPTTPMPYPQLISLFLKKHRVWYLESKEPIERITPVGRNQIGKLNVELPLKSALEGGSPRKKKKTTTEASQMGDTQSSAPASTPPPSFFGASLQTFMENILKDFHIDLSNTNAELLTTIYHRMDLLVEKMDKRQEEMEKRNEEMAAELRAQGALLRSIAAKLDGVPSTSGPSSMPEQVSPFDFDPIDPFEPSSSRPADPFEPSTSGLPDPGPSSITPPSLPPLSIPIVIPENVLLSIPHPDTHETFHITVDDPDSPTPIQPESVPTPVASPTGTEEVVVSSPEQSPIATEVIVPSPSTSIVVYQPPRSPFHSPSITIPPLNLPDPESSSSSGDSQEGFVLPVRPITSVPPSDPPGDRA